MLSVMGYLYHLAGLSLQSWHLLCSPNHLILTKNMSNALNELTKLPFYIDKNLDKINTMHYGYAKQINILHFDFEWPMINYLLCTKSLFCLPFFSLDNVLFSPFFCVCLVLYPLISLFPLLHLFFSLGLSPGSLPMSLSLCTFLSDDLSLK